MASRPSGWRRSLGIPQAEAKAYIERYFARYQGVQDFIEKTLERTRREGFVRTLFGRMRPIPDIESRNPNQRGFAERTAINTPLQGTAADLIKLAMIAIDRKLDRAQVENAHGAAGSRRTALRGSRKRRRRSKPGADGDGRRGQAQGAAGRRSGVRAELARPQIAKREAIRGLRVYVFRYTVFWLLSRSTAAHENSHQKKLCQRSSTVPVAWSAASSALANAEGVAPQAPPATQTPAPPPVKSHKSDAEYNRHAPVVDPDPFAEPLQFTRNELAPKLQFFPLGDVTLEAGPLQQARDFNRGA